MDIQSVFLSETSGASFDVPIFIVMLVLIVLSAFFSMTETAFSSASIIKLKSLVEDQKHGSKKALELADSFDKTVTTLLIGNNIVNVGLSTIAVGFFTKLVIFHNWVDLASTLIVTVVLLIFGEVIPKTFAKNNPETIAVKTSYIVFVLSILFFPFVYLFTLLQKAVTKKNQPEENTLDEDELSILIDEMEENGAIENDEATLIKNVFKGS